MNTKQKHYTAEEFFLLIIWTFYSIYQMSTFINNSSFLQASWRGMYSTFCIYATIVLLMCLFLFEISLNSAWSVKTFIYVVIFILIAFLVEINITDRGLLILILFMVTARPIDFSKLLKYDVKLKTVLLTLVLFLYFVGFSENYARVINGSYKMSLGFTHPNTLAVYVLMILIEWLCIRYKRMHWFDWVGIIGITLIVWNITKSRTSVYTFAAILILYVFANYHENLLEFKIVNICVICAPAFVAFLTFLLEYLYSKGNTLVIRLDSILTGRIRLSYNALQKIGIKLLGSEITFSSAANPADNVTSFLIDNAYVRSTLRWGVIFTVLFIIMYMIHLYKLSKEKEFGLLLMSLFFAILGFAEAYMTSVFYNITLVCFLKSFDQNKTLTREKNS